MAKQFQHSVDARRELMVGIETLARAVGVTLGPAGRNVVLDQDFGPPQICSDGVTIAKEIELPDAFPNMGVQLLKEAASNTNDDVGDGTTTSTADGTTTSMADPQELAGSLPSLQSPSVLLRWANPSGASSPRLCAP